jgi:iron complex transport system ATP-binding protein
MLNLDAATYNLGKRVMGPFTLGIQAGERVAIVGPSGAGKSSLLKLMTRQWLPRTGQARLHGRAMQAWSLAALSQHRAVLPQSSEVAFGLYTDLVVGLGRVARTQDPNLVSIVDAACQIAHADHLLGRRFDSLSGGEQARVQLARVFAQLWDARGGMILVDEPLAALDPGLQLDLLSSLVDYAQARGHALVAILHDINQALAAFDRLLMVKDGRLIADLPSHHHSAIASLELLYDLSLACWTTDQGQVVVTPRRRTPVNDRCSA